MGRRDFKLKLSDLFHSWSDLWATAKRNFGNEIEKWVLNHHHQLSAYTLTSDEAIILYSFFLLFFFFNLVRKASKLCWSYIKIQFTADYT